MKTIRSIIAIAMLACSLTFIGCEKKTASKSGPELFADAEKAAKERLDKLVKDSGKPTEIAEAARQLEIISASRGKAIEDYNAAIKSADQNMTAAAQNAALRAGIVQPTPAPAAVKAEPQKAITPPPATADLPQ